MLAQLQPDLLSGDPDSWQLIVFSATLLAACTRFTSCCTPCCCR